MPKSKVPNIQTKDNKIKHLRQQNNYEDVSYKIIEYAYRLITILHFHT